MLVFEEKGKLEYPEKNLSEQTQSKGENQQQTQPTYASTPGFEPGPHWWEVSALTTAPSLAPQRRGLVLGLYVITATFLLVNS